ncbi:MAG: PA2779 family protein [Candidatus Eisenbacteria bacterium]|uniref:PA2779 family protein n=1 Tax=Eiseniibacteriota bacterium TaxID=2212470 RepID=A0A956NIY0_UNCEI|nr:PA2779 family protein [Candidatus Eisenbacteria bacterium]
MSRTRRLSVPVALSYLTFASAIATAAPADVPNPTHVVNAARVQNAINAQVAAEDAQRERLQKILAAPQVERVAERAGIDMETARERVATLSGEELQQVTHQSAGLDAELAGGDTIVISATAVIIVLLLLILLTD